MDRPSEAFLSEVQIDREILVVGTEIVVTADLVAEGYDGTSSKAVTFLVINGNSVIVKLNRTVVTVLDASDKLRLAYDLDLDPAFLLGKLFTGRACCSYDYRRLRRLNCGRP